MPHKHTRRPGAANTADYNLPPTNLAKPLPAFSGGVPKDGKKTQLKRGQRKPQTNQSVKRKRDAADAVVGGDSGSSSSKGYKSDDTPRAFARLMAFQNTGKRVSGLDDGTEGRKAKKRKIAADQKAAAAEAAPKPKPKPAPKVIAEVEELPKILPGERLADYSARVDRALPMSATLARKGNVKVEGVKERVTKTEKRLKKMYASWREEEARRIEKVEEAAEEEEEAEEERRAKYGENYRAAESVVGGKRKRVIGEEVEEEDPWKVLEERREKRKGLHDVVTAPPTMKVVPRERFKVREGARVEVANVPGKAGSLKRREELGGERRGVIQRYREMMKGKSGL
ncbi:hypothetical protein LTR56_011725 [Elasticomyces elasticus]|nr:hypothetical protein LTR22_023935 [Elasticomyces elasticus]KAK3640848.1 hypothetical protein LTR56_011725 [Elasticomyces elasticus]KAK4921136.1 hypothetical protein LTR49_011323 [Elasticomyces elasticus]KAK5761852.1 hypothetical protein LTS12_007915 [Elasticomyces elasticus]